MIIVIDATGTIVSQQTEDLYQGSSRANIINLLAPFASNVEMVANFELPNGDYYPANESGYIMRPSLKITKDLNCWTLPIKFPLTQYKGLVKVQISARSGNQVLCTTTIKLPIQEGVPYIAEELPENTVDEIMQIVGDLRALVNNKVDTENIIYEVAEVDENTTSAYKYYVFNQEENKYELVNLPTDYNENEIYYAIKQTAKIINNKNGLYLQLDVGTVRWVLQITEDGVFIGSNRVVTENSLNSLKNNLQEQIYSLQSDYEIFKSTQQETNLHFDSVINSIDIEQSNIITGKTVVGKAKQDENGNIISETYASKKETTELITNLKVFRAFTFDTKENFLSWINGDFVRTDNISTSDLKIGDTIYIKEENTPDYWVSSISETITIDNFTEIESGVVVFNKPVYETKSVLGWVSAENGVFKYTCTITLETPFENSSLVELINDNAVLFAQYGFAIGNIDGQNLTIYAIEQPSQEVLLTFKVES